MARIAVGSDGRITLPPDFRGSEVVVERREGGLAIWRAEPDVRRVYIEVTTRCNLDCAICVRRVWRDTIGEMTWGTFSMIADQLKAFPALREITLGGFGEPLVHPRILDMVTRASALGAAVSLTTNGLLLDRSMTESLVAARLGTVVVSVDTAHLQAYREAGVAGGLDTVLENIRGLRAIARQRGLMAPRIGLEFVVTRSNMEDLARLPGLTRALGASFVLVTHLLPHAPDQADDIAYDRGQPLAVPMGWPVAGVDWVTWGVARLPRGKWGAQRRCRFVEDRALVIGWDGRVSPCYALMHSYPYYIYGRRKDVTRFVLGSVHEQTLAEIWASVEYVTFRARVRDFRFPSCVDCNEACAYAARNEDCWANVPSCADCLWAQDIIRCP